jgi:GNAT superfamily N-acetyltransferase
MTLVPVTRTYLEMRSPAALRAARAPRADATVAREAPCAIETYRALYERVGRAWHWRERLAWSDETLAAHLARPNVGVWMLRVGDEVAGYFELVHHEDASIEIAYFGLDPERVGQGLGGWLLTRAAEVAWARGASRVWLHTCTLDGPAALPNYLARGFVPYRTEKYDTEL